MAAPLTRGQRLELLAGPDPERPAFVSDRARFDAYLRHQHELHDGLPPGRRPWAFWAYLVDEQPALDDEPRRLAERELLHPDEEAAILLLAADDPAIAAAASVIQDRARRNDGAEPG